MTNYNYIMIRRNGLTITGQTETWAEAMRAMQRMRTDPFYTGHGQAAFQRFFLATTDGNDGIMEYTASEVQAVG